MGCLAGCIECHLQTDVMHPLHAVKSSSVVVLCWPRVLDKYGYVSVYVQCAGTYGPMSLDKGPNKGQGPLDGALYADVVRQ